MSYNHIDYAKMSVREARLKKAPIKSFREKVEADEAKVAARKIYDIEKGKRTRELARRKKISPLIWIVNVVNALFRE